MCVLLMGEKVWWEEVPKKEARAKFISIEMSVFDLNEFGCGC